MAALMMNKNSMATYTQPVKIDVLSPVKEDIPDYLKFKSFYIQFAPQFDEHLRTIFKSNIKPSDDDTKEIKAKKIEATVFMILITVFGTQIFPFDLYKDLLDIPSLIRYAQTKWGGEYTINGVRYSSKTFDSQYGGASFAQISALVFAFGAVASSIFKADYSSRNVVNVEQQLVGAVNLLEQGNDMLMDHAKFSWERVKDLYDDSIEFATCMSNKSTDKWHCYSMAPALLDNLLGDGRFETNAEFNVQVTYDVPGTEDRTVSYVLGPASDFSDYLNASLYPDEYNGSVLSQAKRYAGAYLSGISYQDMVTIIDNFDKLDPILGRQVSLIADSLGKNTKAIRVVQQGFKLYTGIIPAVLKQLQKGAEHQVVKMGDVANLSLDLAEQSIQVKTDFVQLGAALLALYAAIRAFKPKPQSEEGGGKTRNKRTTNKKKRKTIKRRKTNKRRKVSRK